MLIDDIDKVSRSSIFLLRITLQYHYPIIVQYAYYTDTKTRYRYCIQMRVHQGSTHKVFHFKTYYDSP